MIKGKPPYPFETIALAVEFSPGLPFLIDETKRLCQLHNSLAVFIHVGKKTGEKQRELANLLTMNGFHDGNSRIYWEQGEIVNSILKICKSEVADLLIAGASQNENFNLPVGMNAAGLATKAKCSVLIYRNAVNSDVKKIVVNNAEHKKSDMTFHTALYFADKENVPELFVSGENSDSFEEAANEFNNQGTENSFLSNPTINEKKVIVNYFSLAKENCSSIAEYAFKNNVDFIITHSSDHHLLIFDRISSSDGIDTMLKNLPCNLLIVHTRLPE
jgi:hypothetical protein